MSSPARNSGVYFIDKYCYSNFFVVVLRKAWFQELFCLIYSNQSLRRPYKNWTRKHVKGVRTTLMRYFGIWNNFWRFPIPAISDSHTPFKLWNFPISIFFRNSVITGPSSYCILSWWSSDRFRGCWIRRQTSVFVDPIQKVSDSGVKPRCPGLTTLSWNSISANNSY